MAKISVDVFTPGNGKSYEFQLDDSIDVQTAKTRMVDEILQLEERGMSFHSFVMLCDATTKRALPDNLPLSATDVKSGHKLLLV